jgi:hypothetical protein
VTVAPLQLAYDDLPPGSDVRREYGADGSVRIIVPAGDVPGPVRRAAGHRALVTGAGYAAPVLMGSLAVFVYFVRANRVAGVPLAWAVAFFGIFCTAIVALVAWVRYQMLTEAAQAGRRQATILVASRARLLVETSGPFGVAGYDLPRDRVASVWFGSWGRMTDRAGREQRTTHLLIGLSDHMAVKLLPGRDVEELRWVAGAIAQALGLPPPRNLDEMQR